MLSTPCWCYGVAPAGAGSYRVYFYFDRSKDANFIRVNDILLDSAKNKYKINVWQNYPEDYQNNRWLIVEYITNDVPPVESVTKADCVVYTEGEIDIRPPVYTDGNILSSIVHNAQNSEFRISAMWNNVVERDKAVIGDYISDSRGKLYKIKSFGLTDKWTGVIVEEVDKENIPPSLGDAFLFRPTEHVRLYLGGRLNHDQLLRLINRDNVLIDYFLNQASQLTLNEYLAAIDQHLHVGASPTFDGANITNLNASNLTHGMVSEELIPPIKIDGGYV